MASKSAEPISLRERNRVRARNDILDAAAEILGEEGYAGTTLEELSQRAGLSRGTLYAHFPQGREEIVREVYLRIADAVYVHGISRREHAVDPVARIVALAAALVEATKASTGRFYGVMGADIVPVLASVMGSTSRSFEQLIREDLQDAATQSLLAPEFPVDAVAAALTGTIRACGAAAALAPDRADDHIEAVRLLTTGLFTPARA